MNFLNLPSWEIVSSKETDDDYEITARPIQPLTACPFCGNSMLLRHGTDAQVIHDVPAHGKRVVILVDHQRWRCTSCGRTFFEPLPDVDEKRFCTRRLITYLERGSMSRTFLSLAEEVGLHEKTVRRIFRNYWDAETKDEASQRYVTWQAGITSDLSEAFTPIALTVEEWGDELFAYFDHRVTNAYTESLNGLARVANRLGRGYSFEVLRTRLLYGIGQHPNRKPKKEKTEEQSVDSESPGIPLSTLSEQS